MTSSNPFYALADFPGVHHAAPAGEPYPDPSRTESAGHYVPRVCRPIQHSEPITASDLLAAIDFRRHRLAMLGHVAFVTERLQVLEPVIALAPADAPYSDVVNFRVREADELVAGESYPAIGYPSLTATVVTSEYLGAPRLPRRRRPANLPPIPPGQPARLFGCGRLVDVRH
jgi:hypothetical protein